MEAMDITVNPDFNLDAIVLSHGGHVPGDNMCFMEAASVAAGEEWSDHPTCVSKVIGAFGRRINDAMDEESRQSLKPYVLKVLGTAASVGVEVKRAKLAADWAQQFENADARDAAAHATTAATYAARDAAAHAAHAAAAATYAAAYATYAAEATAHAATAATAAAYAAEATAAAATYAAAYAYAARRQFWADLTPSILALLDAMIAVTEEQD
jgi:hypothetical protein